jgi:hypothetical protein
MAAKAEPAFGKSITDFLLENNPKGVAPLVTQVPAAPGRSWTEPLGELRARWYTDETQSAEDFNDLMGGSLPPPKFAIWYASNAGFYALVHYLDEKRPLEAR